MVIIWVVELSWRFLGPGSSNLPGSALEELSPIVRICLNCIWHYVKSVHVAYVNVLMNFLFPEKKKKFATRDNANSQQAIEANEMIHTSSILL